MGEYISMPKLDMSMENATIVEWLVSVGDYLPTGTNFVEVETGKVSIEVDSTAQPGTVLMIYYEEGDTVDVGVPIAYVGEAGETAPPKKEALSTAAANLEPTFLPKESPRAYEFDLAVIGGGPAGYSCAMEAAKRQKRVALFEAGEGGGARLFGRLPEPEKAPGSFAEAKARLARKAESMQAQMAKELEDAGVQVILEKAHLPAPGLVASESKAISAEHIAIATGSACEHTAIPSDGSVRFLYGEEAFRLEKAPKSVAIAPSSIWGVEAACLLASFGASVAVLSKSSRLFEGLDEDVEKALLKSLEEKGVRFVANAVAQKAENGTLILADGRTLEAGLCIAGEGKRCRQVENALGLSAGASGFYTTDASFQTHKSGIYAIGAASGQCGSDEEAFYAGASLAAALFGGEEAATPAFIAKRITSPLGAAWVGLAREEAERRGIPCKVCKIGGQANGFVKVIADSRWGEIVGVHAVGEGAEEIATLASLAMNGELSLHEVAQSAFYYPSASQAFFLACRSLAAE